MHVYMSFSSQHMHVLSIQQLSYIFNTTHKSEIEHWSSHSMACLVFITQAIQLAIFFSIDKTIDKTKIDNIN